MYILKRLLSFPGQIFTTLLSINILFRSVKKIARSDMLSLDIPIRFESAEISTRFWKNCFGEFWFPDFSRVIIFILFASVGVICEK